LMQISEEFFRTQFIFSYQIKPKNKYKTKK